MILSNLKIELFQIICITCCLAIVVPKDTRPEVIWNKYISKIANFTLYFMLNRAIEELYRVVDKVATRSKAPARHHHALGTVSSYVLVTAASLLYRDNTTLEELTFFSIAYLISKIVVMQSTLSNITYGVGMATSFFEGYLTHVLPNDGTGNGFLDKIITYENAHNVKFPVKRLFIICTESMHSPPDLKEFNHQNRADLAQLVDCQSLQDVEKDVAGVKRRIYRTSIYKIIREGRPPVYIAAECATPLHTLHKALAKAHIYTDLRKADVSTIVREFTESLREIIHNSPDSRGKCELVYFNDLDSRLNLADVLLKRVEKIEKKFENFI